MPPVSVVFANRKASYIEGLTRFREGHLDTWIERFAAATARAAGLAERYLAALADLQDRWRARLRQRANVRADAAAWAVIDQLPGHPIVTLPVATALTGRSKSSTAVAIDQLADAGILLPVSVSKRNRSWEAEGLLELLAGLEGMA